MTHPYTSLPEQAFWKTAVADRNPLQISGLWSPKFPVLKKHRIVTAGSCFAQHIGRALAARGYSWFDAEILPPFLSAEDAQAFNYGVFSFRTGNIYTARTLLQWLTLAYGERDEIDEVWESEGRFYDPLRPAIEPGGFSSAEEMLASRQITLAAIRRAVEEANLFVFTLGLTESWRNKDSGVEYALCPGTLAGSFDADRQEFHNHCFASILRDMTKVMRLLRSKNPKIRVLLTVSPVPLTATASGKHVLTATVQSKSVLRAVAGQLAETFRFVDYFPSYEIITAPPFRGMFYGANMRSVVPEGVNVVMQSFFADQQAAFGATKGKAAKSKEAGAGRGGKRAMTPETSAEDVKCEEEMLGAFAKS